MEFPIVSLFSLIKKNFSVLISEIPMIFSIPHLVEFINIIKWTEMCEFNYQLITLREISTFYLPCTHKKKPE